jgi:putative oxidoreductase
MPPPGNERLAGEETMAMSQTSSSRYYIPAFAGLYAGFDALVLSILRVGLGVVLIPHGCQKLFGMFSGMGLNANAALFDKLGYQPGMFWGTLVGCTELIAGCLLVIGLFTRLAALSVVIFMIVAVHFTSTTNGFFWTKSGMEYPLLILLSALVFLVRGGGAYSVDSAMAKEF